MLKVNIELCNYISYSSDALHHLIVWIIIQNINFMNSFLWILYFSYETVLLLFLFKDFVKEQPPILYTKQQQFVGPVIDEYEYCS